MNRQPSTTLLNGTPKLHRRTSRRKHLSIINLSIHNSPDFLKISSLWEAALKTERSGFSKFILGRNVTPIISSGVSQRWAYSPVWNKSAGWIGGIITSPKHFSYICWLWNSIHLYTIQYNYEIIHWAASLCFTFT